MPTDVDELAKLVATAKQATDSLGGTDLQRVAFERVLEHLLQNGTDGGSTHTGRERLAEASAERTSHSADGAFAEEQQRIDAIASYFKITPMRCRFCLTLRRKILLWPWVLRACPGQKP